MALYFEIRLPGPIPITKITNIHFYLFILFSGGEEIYRRLFFFRNTPLYSLYNIFIIYIILYVGYLLIIHIWTEKKHSKIRYFFGVTTKYFVQT